MNVLGNSKIKKNVKPIFPLYPKKSQGSNNLQQNGRILTEKKIIGITLQTESTKGDYPRNLT